MEGSSFVLCRSQGGQEAGTSGRILGGTCGCSNVEVLVTVQGDGVVAYNSAKQQRIRSWPLGSGASTFAVPAVWDSQTSRYYAALGSPSAAEHQLVAWGKEQDAGSLADFKKEALGGVVHSLWPASRSKSEGESSSGSIVVFQDGTLAAFGEDLSRTCELRASGKTTVEAVAFCNEKSAPLLAIVERAVGKRSVRIVELRREGFEERRLVELGALKGSSVVSASLGGDLKVSLLWSDRRWQCYTGEELTHERTLEIFKGDEDASAKNKKSTKKKRANEEREDGSGKFSGRLIALPGSHYVVAVGAEGNGALVALVLDTQFGCLHRKLVLAGDSDGDRKTDSLSALIDSSRGQAQPVVDLQLGGEEGQLLVSTSERVIVCDLALPPLSLANMLGALAPVPAGTSLMVPPGEASGSGWRGTAVEAAATVSGVYKETEMEALRTPVSGVVLTPSISGRDVESMETSLIHREESEVWDTDVITRLGKAEAEVLRKIQELKSEQEVMSLLLQHLGGELAEVSGPNGSLDGPKIANFPTNGHANGNEDSDDSEMADALPNGVVHENGKPKKKKGVTERPKQLSKVLRKCSLPLLSAIIERSLHSQFWSLLESVLWSGNLSAVSVGPFLVRELAEAQQLRLLEIALPHFRDLAPTDVAFLLHFLIKSADSGALQKQAADRKQRVLLKLDKLASAKREGQLSKARRKEVRAVNLVADAVDLFDPREAALHPLVAAPRDETVLAAALRELDASEVSFLSAYLTKWMDVYFDRSEASAPKWGTILVPSLAQVVLWLSVLLDVHLTRLALLPECHQILSRLHKVVSAQIIIARKLVALGGIASHIQSKAKLPPRRAPSGKPAQGYSVEVLSLG